ncbi:DMT family transporter [Paenibacillus sp. sptzw28]|uniref:EamA family transporter n=1 Tax=Paenibacillus sp. sptzw28 TaxID=715179 RepID=UPI001C6F47A2|nr:EamA family transporter [Paenibacillus sp. sptzw28]QYR20483.1 DMT family transporter [Paenibacillus sp. sptzw28]
MWFAAALGSALLFGLAGWWMKVSQMQNGSSAFLLLGLYISGTLGFGVHAAAEHTLASSLADSRVWAAGLLIGAGSALGNALFMKALACGPASLTSPLTNMNIVLVIALGTFAYDEPFTGSELAGVTLLLMAVVFVSIRGKEKLTISRKNWYFYVGVSIVLFAVRNGGLKVTGEMGLEGAPVLFVAYLLSIVWFTGTVLREQNALQPLGAFYTAEAAGRMMRQSAASARIGMRWGIIAGLFSYGGLQLYAVSLQTGQANIAGPIFASNSLVVAVGSIVLYKEKLTTLQWIAFILMFAGLILIRL